jgi:hypothetical protein
MNATLEIILKIIGAVIAIAGLIVVYGAGRIVKAKKLDEKKKVDPERIALLDEEQVKKFKHDQAILDVKIAGVLIALPGFVLLLILFKI